MDELNILDFHIHSMSVLILLIAPVTQAVGKATIPKFSSSQFLLTTCCVSSSVLEQDNEPQAAHFRRNCKLL